MNLGEMESPIALGSDANVCVGLARETQILIEVVKNECCEIDEDLSHANHGWHTGHQ